MQIPFSVILIPAAFIILVAKITYSLLKEHIDERFDRLEALVKREQANEEMPNKMQG